MASVACLALNNEKAAALQLNSDINMGGHIEDLLFLQISEEPAAEKAELPPTGDHKVPDVEVETIDDKVNK